MDAKLWNGVREPSVAWVLPVLWGLGVQDASLSLWWPLGCLYWDKWGRAQDDMLPEFKASVPRSGGGGGGHLFAAIDSKEAPGCPMCPMLLEGSGLASHSSGSRCCWAPVICRGRGRSGLGKDQVQLSCGVHCFDSFLVLARGQTP